MYEAIPGVGIYSAEPTVEDTSNRGSLSGSRTEVVTYVFEQAGEVQIPDIELNWWNLSDNKLEQVILPGQRIRVAGGRVSGSATLPVKQLNKTYLVPFVIVLLLVSFIFYYFRKRLIKHWITRRQVKKESEERYYQMVQKSIRSKKSDRALRSIMRWLDRINNTSDPAQLDDFINRYGDAGAREVVNQLLQCVAVNERLSDPTQLLDVLSAARKNWQQASERRQFSVNALPALNP